jgi:hypothetical protein
MPRTISEAHKKAMAAGRKKKADARAREEIVPRVQAFKDWVGEVAEFSRRLRAHNLYGHDHPGQRPKMPTIPSDEDYKVYRRIQGDTLADD